MTKLFSTTIAVSLACLAALAGCAVDPGHDEVSSTEQASRFWPGCDGMNPTLTQCVREMAEGDVTCTFAKADFDKCQADLHRFVGVTVTYNCSNGTTQTKKYVTGLNRGDGFSTNDQAQYEAGTASCSYVSSTTKYDDISAINAIMPDIHDEAQPLWQLTYLLPVHLTPPCWEARQRCLQVIENNAEGKTAEDGVTAGQAIKDATWLVTNKCNWDYYAGQCRADIANVDYECGLRCGSSVPCKTACYTTVNDWCKTSSWVGC